MSANVGDRVAAMHSCKNGVVTLFGFGVYEGPKTPLPQTRLLGDAFSELCERTPGLAEKFTNPCIRLDSGQLVFGCECWWGSEAQFRDRYPECEFTYEYADIDEARKVAEALSHD